MDSFITSVIIGSLFGIGVGEFVNATIVGFIQDIISKWPFDDEQVAITQHLQQGDTFD